MNHTATKTIFIFFLIFLAGSASGISLELDAPDSAELNEEFVVTISADEQGTFDVKVFVHSSDDESVSRGEYISEIFDDDWKDAWYYLKGSFPQETEYLVRVTNSPGERTLCIRLRKTDSSSGFEQLCKNIEILPGKSDEPSEKKEKKKTSLENKTNPTVQSNNSFTAPTPDKLSANETEIIRLNNQPQKQIILHTKQDKLKNLFVYSFAGFLFALVVLLALKRL